MIFNAYSSFSAIIKPLLPNNLTQFYSIGVPAPNITCDSLVPSLLFKISSFPSPKTINSPSISFYFYSFPPTLHFPSKTKANPYVYSSLIGTYKVFPYSTIACPYTNSGRAFKKRGDFYPCIVPYKTLTLPPSNYITGTFID